jgi:hypothetical protein
MQDRQAAQITRKPRSARAPTFCGGGPLLRSSAGARTECIGKEVTPVTNTTHLVIQLWLILVLSLTDALVAVVQHPEWFQ